MFSQPDSGRFEGVALPAGRTGRWRRRFLLSFAAAALFVFVAVAVLYFQVTRSSLNLEFVRNQFQSALESRLPANVEVTIGSAYLAYRSDAGLIAQARDIAFDIPGRAEIRIRSLDATADVTDLFAARFNPHTLSADGLDIALMPLRPGAAAGRRIDRTRAMAELVARSVVDADTGLRNAGFQELRVRNLAISVYRRAPPDTGAEAAVPGSGDNPADDNQLLVQRVAETVWAPLEPGRSKIWSQISAGGSDVVFKIERVTDEQGRHRVEAFLDQFPAAMLLPALGDPGGPIQYDARGSLRARIDLAPHGDFAGVRARLTLGSGDLLINRRHTVPVDGADLFVDLGPESDRLALRRGLLLSGLSQFQISGWIDLAESGDPLMLRARLGESFVPALGADAGDNAAAVRLAGGSINATLDPRNWNLEIENLEVTGPSGRASLLGNLQFGGDSPGIALAIQLQRTDAAVVRGLWPAFLAVRARDWFSANVSGGTIGPGVVQVALPMDELRKRKRVQPLPDYAVTGTVGFRDARFTPMPFFPQITAARGEVTFERSAVAIRLAAGEADISGHGALDLSGSGITIPRLGAPDPLGQIDLRLSGPAAALAEVADAGPLAVSESRGIDPAALSGEGRLSLNVEVPFTDPDALVRLSPQFELALLGFSSTRSIDGRRITDADIVMKGNPDTFTITGSATVDGIPADLDLVSGRAAEGDAVRLTLDDETRRRLGFDLGNMLTGPVAATFGDAGGGARRLFLDLQNARISLPFAAWEKGFGVAGSAEFTYRDAADGAHLDDIVVTGRGFRATGKARLRPKGGIATLDLDEVSLRPGDSFSVKMVADGDGFDIAIAGESFDARGLISRLKSDSSTSSWDMPPVRVAVDIQRINGYNRVVLHDLKGSARFSGDRIRSLSLAGTTGKTQPLNWEISEEGKTRSQHFRAANGGAILRFVDLYTKILGGELEIRQDGPQNGEFAAGGLVLRNFRVVNERMLAQAVQNRAGSESTAIRDDVGRAVDAANMVFAVLQIPFRRDGSTISLTNAALRGPAIGGTASGTVNLDDRQIAISGTVVPIYGLNNIAGSIPLFGAILGGGRNEGLLGLTYRIFGPMDAPTMQMNPVSVIAPGIFRKIFEFR